MAFWRSRAIGHKPQFPWAGNGRLSSTPKRNHPKQTYNSSPTGSNDAFTVIFSSPFGPVSNISRFPCSTLRICINLNGLVLQLNPPRPLCKWCESGYHLAFFQIDWWGRRLTGRAFPSSSWIRQICCSFFNIGIMLFGKLAAPGVGKSREIGINWNDKIINQVHSPYAYSSSISNFAFLHQSPLP